MRGIAERLYTRRGKREERSLHYGRDDIGEREERSLHYGRDDIGEREERSLHYGRDDRSGKEKRGPSTTVGMTDRRSG
jgi:hypothetical protein